MITLYLLFTFVMVCVTMSTLTYISRTLRDSRHKRLSGVLFAILSSVPATMAINVGISYFLLSFTGSGMLAGMSNLTSSILVGVVGKRWMNKIYKENENVGSSFRTRLENLGKACDVSAFVRGWFLPGDQGRAETDND